MSGSRLEELEELAFEALSADIADSESLESLRSGLEDLKSHWDTAGDPDAAREIETCLATLEHLVAGTGDTREADLEAVISGLETLQSRLLVGGKAQTASDSPAANGRFELPEWVDEETFREFLSDQRLSQEELEADILALEAQGEEALASLKRRLHTLKGEAGTLGLEALEAFCHQLEDALEAIMGSPDRVDRLLSARDWIGRSLDAYGAGRFPEAAPDLAASAEPGSSEGTVLEPSDPAPPPVPEWTGEVESIPQPETPDDSEVVIFGNPVSAEVPAAQELAAGLAERIDRDEETISLLGDFLQEGGDGLDEADRLLMRSEKEGLDSDTVHAVFRVFHTLKGVAGFLELADITALAHTSETLLDRAREGQLTLTGGVVDVIFDAIEMMRGMLSEVRDATEAGEPFPETTGLEPLLERLRSASEGTSQAQSIVPAVPPSARVGDILQETACIDAKLVAEAAEAQRQTGRKIGEELAARGLAKPRQVAEALRAQQESRSNARIRETVKVDLERVDRLVETIGELVVVESMVTNVPEIAKAQSLKLRNYLGQLSKITRDLQDMAMGMRTVPVRGLFQKMARMVRDLGSRAGKRVELIASGEGTEMDRSMVEHLADPLVHMIRNAVDHGIEPEDERVSAGKPAAGQVRLSAYHEGGSIVIEISDDGRGLDREAIRLKAVDQGLITPEAKLSDSEMFQLIFAAGFSTAAKVTEISGRGVGMDVVRRNIEAMRGRVTISSSVGEGSTFKIVLPLTLAIIDGMLVACGEERYIVPTLSIVESFQPTREMLASCAGSLELIHQRGETIPLVRMDRIFGIEGAHQDPTEALVVVVETLGRKLGLLVDDVVTQQQVVIKSLGSSLEGIGFVAGGAILSDGQVGLILNVDELERLAPVARGTPSEPTAEPEPEPEAEDPSPQVKGGSE